MKRHTNLQLLFCAVLAFVLMTPYLVYARAKEVVVGVNVINPLRAKAAEQKALINQLADAHVRVIRCSITPDQNGINFANLAYSKGIKILLGVSPKFPADAPTRTYQPDKFPGMWSGHQLSSADPELSKTYYQELLDKLEANGIVLAGLELGNEINWAAFNQDFPLPGEGKVLNFHDLSHDPEGKQIAKGFLQYVKVISALKDVRDHSRLNQNTPIISAGLVTALDGEKLYNNKKEDMVSLNATLQFLRWKGIDSLVDAYGIHFYPPDWKPGTPEGLEKRADRFARTLTACLPAGAATGKPCWVTEWGFDNHDLSCPTKDNNQHLLVKEMRDIFANAAEQGRLAAIIYFCWNSDPWSKKPDPKSAYRCGVLTDSGRLAISPMRAR